VELAPSILTAVATLVVPIVGIGALFPASSEREKISFHQINKKTGNRIKYRKVDAETGDEVDSSDIVKGYEVGKSNTSRLSPKNSSPSPLRASEPSRLTSSCLRKKSTSCI
jgi:hypothetical protein